MIFKVVKSEDGKKVIIHNKNNSQRGEFPFNLPMELLMMNEPVIFISADIDIHGSLSINRKVKARSW